MAKNEQEQFQLKRSRYLGCLLGGAVGDALGYPVEFMSEASIRAKYGPHGIQTLAQAGHPAQISDDTQMTLFAANALLYHMTCGGDLTQALWLAYREWLSTQGDTSRMDDPGAPTMWLYREPRLHARRAPGNSCLSALRNSPNGGTLCAPVNDSKGCGTVMRAAPFGLAVCQKDTRGDGHLFVHRLAMGDAILTHGHPLARASSSILAQIIYEIVQARPKRNYHLQDAILGAGVPGGNEISALLKDAVKLALNRSVSDLEGIHKLGEGWVAEEALAIAVFCAVRYQKDFAAAIRAAVNHKGDSDSTGAICGNILGAWLGRDAVAAFDLNDLELRDVIETIAGDLLQAVEYGPKHRPGQPICNPMALAWYQKYCCGGKRVIPFCGVALSCGQLDLADFKNDALVVSTDAAFSGSGGLDAAVCQAAGPRLQQARRAFPPTEIGHVQASVGFALAGCQCIVHAVTPPYKPENRPLLTACYARCLAVARDFPSLALPLLGVGSLGWPAEESMECAWQAILRFAFEQCNPMYSGVPETLCEIHLCGSEKTQPVIREFLARRSRVFLRFPPFRATRGDVYLWQEMLFHFDDPKFNRLNLNDFLAETLAFYTQSTGSAPFAEEPVYVERLNHGGMSGGAVSGEWWRTVALPLLCQTYCALGFATQEERQAVQAAVNGQELLPRLPALEGPFAAGSGTPEPAQPAAPAPAPAAGVPATPAPLAPLRPVGLMYTPLTKKALAICFDAHKNQRDKGGLPYVFHPFHLAEQMETEEEVCTALLHDVVEDTPWTLEALHREGFPEPVLAALSLLTHADGVPYMEYILAVRKNPIARRVKLADLAHNSDAARLAAPAVQDRRRLQKYRIAQALLADDAYDETLHLYRKVLPLDGQGNRALAVYYRQGGAVEKYRLEASEAAAIHGALRCEFGPDAAEALRCALDAKRSLPEALAEYLAGLDGDALESLLRRLRIPYRPVHSF